MKYKTPGFLKTFLLKNTRDNSSFFRIILRRLANFPVFFSLSILIIYLFPFSLPEYVILFQLVYVIYGNIYLGFKTGVVLLKYPRIIVFLSSIFLGIAVFYAGVEELIAPLITIINLLFLYTGLGFYFAIALVALLGKNKINTISKFLPFLKYYFKIPNLFVQIFKFIIRNKRLSLKFFIVVGTTFYVIFTMIIGIDYLRTQYGGFDKILCTFGIHDIVQKKVVRIVGGNSEGSGFFIAPDQILTNFHVISDEPTPKIIFPDGKFITVSKILGDKEKDLAVLFTHEQYPQFVFKVPEEINLIDDEKLTAAGYPWGTYLKGDATLLKGRFIDYRSTKKKPIDYLQTDISLVEGMSGGPLVDQCGRAVGINTLGIAGLSLFINANSAQKIIPTLTDQGISKITIDYTSSPVKAVEAFYTFLKSRRMEEGFMLLSAEYLKKTNLDEWTSRFKDVIDVDIILTKPKEGTTDTVFLKFSTKNWNEGEVTYHYYEGTWQTVIENNSYKMLKSNIKEVSEPNWDWYYN